MRFELKPTFLGCLIHPEPSNYELAQAIGLEYDVNTIVYHGDGQVSIDTAEVQLTEAQKHQLEQKLMAHIVEEAK